MTPVTIKLPRRRIIRALVVLVLALSLASAAAQVVKYVLGQESALGFVPLLDADGEANLPTWYASLALLACAVVLAIIAVEARRTGKRHGLAWAALSLTLLLASLDEAAGLHELAGELVGRVVHQTNLFYSLWPGLLVVAGVTFGFRRFFADLPRDTRRRFLLAWAVFVGSALGVELLEILVERAGLADTFVLGMLRTLQELGEMLGVIVFLDALLAYAASHLRPVTYTFTHSDTAPHVTAGRAARPRDGAGVGARG